MSSESFFRTCPDGHRCENGSTCVEDPSLEGTYFCDCMTSSGDFAGLFCEYEAENYCRFPQEVASSWFCTNRGTCVVSVADSSAWTCDCPNDYEGPHCEYIDGALPSDWPGIASSKRSSKGGDGLKTGVMVTIILVAVVVVGMMALLIVKKRQAASEFRPDQNAPKDQSEALHIEMDGGVLQEVVKSMNSGKSSNTENFDFEAVDGVSVEVGHTQTKAPSFKAKDSKSKGVGHGQIL